MRCASKQNLILIGIGLALVGLISYLLLSNNQDGSDSPDQAENKTVSIKTETSSYIRDLNHDLTVELPNDFGADLAGRFDVSFKQLACRNLFEYLGSDSPAAARKQLSDYASTFQAVRRTILNRADLPAVSQLVWEDGLSQDILNQGQDIYGNFRLLANYDHYLEQQPDLAVFDTQDLDFVRRGQVIAYALHYAASPAAQPRPDIAYGLTTEGTSGQPALNYAATVEIISQNLDRYRICDLTYIYTNSSGRGLSSHDFGDICRSGTLVRPAEFAFILPSLPSIAYVNQTINHPGSWPIGYEFLTEDCDGSYIDRNQTHQRVVQFLMPIDAELETLTVDVLDQNITLD